MPPEPAIIDTTVIQVKSTTKNTYGDLIVTPTVGEDVKIGNKRSNLFDVFQEGRAVKLYWAEYMHKKYVSKAELFDGKPPIGKQVEQITTGKGVPSIAETVTRCEHKSSPETGMWWGQMGEMLRCGDIDLETPEGKHLRNAYYAEMLRVLGINIKEVASAKHNLKDEAVKLGATEVKKGGNQPNIV